MKAFTGKDTEISSGLKTPIYCSEDRKWAPPNGANDWMRRYTDDTVKSPIKSFLRPNASIWYLMELDGILSLMYYCWTGLLVWLVAVRECEARIYTPEEKNFYYVAQWRIDWLAAQFTRLSTRRFKTHYICDNFTMCESAQMIMSISTYFER